MRMRGWGSSVVPRAIEYNDWDCVRRELDGGGVVVDRNLVLVRVVWVARVARVWGGLSCSGCVVGVGCRG